jgi:hypothetical protein
MEMQGVVGTLQGLLCRYEEREERLRRALNRLRDMIREVRGSSDSVSLTGIEEALDGLARQETLERLADQVGEEVVTRAVIEGDTPLSETGSLHQKATTLIRGLEDVRARIVEIEAALQNTGSGQGAEPGATPEGLAQQETLETLAGEVGERGTSGTVHQRLTALEHATTGVARAPRMEERLNMLEGIVKEHRVHWQVERILAQNQTPEPYRSALLAMMTSSMSNLAGGNRYFVETWGNGRAETCMTHIFASASGDHCQWYFGAVVKIVTKAVGDTYSQVITAIEGDANNAMRSTEEWEPEESYHIMMVKCPLEPTVSITGRSDHGGTQTASIKIIHGEAVSLLTPPPLVEDQMSSSGHLPTINQNAATHYPQHCISIAIPKKQ